MRHLNFLPAFSSLLILTLWLQSCKPTELLPVIETGTPEHITQTSAQCSGKFVSEGSADIQSVGILIGLSEELDLENYLIKETAPANLSDFEMTIFGMKVRTDYFVRAFAQTDEGVSYGDMHAFSTLYYGYINDRQGNNYMTVQLNGKEWLADNLRATVYSDGSPIESGLNLSDKKLSETGSYRIYPHEQTEGIENESDMVQAYGALYNWQVVADPRGICPTGWHIPTSEEWTELENFLGGAQIAGAKLKCSKVHPVPHPRWDTGHQTINNAAGYRGMPGGLMHATGEFSGLGQMGAVWLASETSDDTAEQFILHLESPVAGRTNADKNSGAAIRCVKD